MRKFNLKNKALALIVAASFLYSGLIFKDHYAKRYSGEQERAAKKTSTL